MAMLIQLCVILVLISDVKCFDITECQTIEGEMEFGQLKRFQEFSADVELDSVPIEETIALVANSNLMNPRWRGQNLLDELKIKTQLIDTDDNKVHFLASIRETKFNNATIGGSSFKSELDGKNSKVQCPYRDYFNGTYLICCPVVEDSAVLKITHEHYNFSAYEIYYDEDKNISRKVNKVIFEEVVTSPHPIVSLREDYTSCWKRDMTERMGYWIKKEEDWLWVVDGCAFQSLSKEETRECVKLKFHDVVTMVGDTHLRNYFYYIASNLKSGIASKLVDGEDQRDINLGRSYRFHKRNIAYTVDASLRDYLQHSKYYDFPRLLVVNLGVKDILTRLIVDYIFAVIDLSHMIKMIQDSGTTVIWVPMSAVPGQAFVDTADPSNSLLRALNFYTCKKMKQIAGVRCTPGLYSSLSWLDKFVCPGKTHTMCFKSHYQVITPGRLTADSIIKQAC